MAVELKVNAINQLVLLRNSTFKDKLSFLDEDVQNAQRAGATEVRITTDYYGHTVTIENNGAVLDDPQKLFAIAESGWDENTQNTENPFGMGFFSNITVSDDLEIRTGDKIIRFNVPEIIRTRNIEIPVEKTEETYDGFKLILNGVDFSKVNTSQIRERAEILGQYVTELDIWYNGEPIEKKDLTEGDDSPFQFPVEDETATGWIALGDNYMYSDNLCVFLRGRLVTKLPDMPYLKGCLHVKDSTLNLTAPDRKDIIRDEKLSSFKERVKDMVKDYCMEILDEGYRKLDDYTSAFNWYSDTDAMKHRMQFLTLKSRNTEDMKYLRGIALAQKEHNASNYEEYMDYLLRLEKGDSEQNEERMGEIQIPVEVQSKPEEPKGRVYHESRTEYSEGYTEVPEIEDDETQECPGMKILDSDEPVFFMKFSEVEEYERLINVVKHYNLRLILSRNRVEHKVLERLQSEKRLPVFHISELKEEVKVTGTLSNTVLNGQERRGLMILGLISRILGFDHNVFAIGDLIVTKRINMPVLQTEKETVETNVTVLHDLDNGKVYVDRTVFNKNRLSDSLDETLTVPDYQFVMSNLRKISEQVSLLTDRKKAECMDTILDALGNGKA